VLAVEHDVAGVQRHQADDHVERGRLARAVGAEQADHLAAFHVKRHVLDHRARTVALLQMADDQRAGSRGLRRCSLGGEGGGGHKRS